VGDAGITFDTRKFTWIGTPIFENNTLVTWHTSPVKTVADAQRLEVAVGATGFNTSAQYPQVMNSLLGTKFKIIMGYPGGNEINLAMETGEVAGRGSNNWTSWKSTKPDWIRDKKINIIVQIGLTKAADLPDVPLLIDLAKNEDDRAALKLVSAPPSVGRPIFSTPNVPADRVQVLRAAFDATMKDPAFLEEAKKLGLDINPISGVDLEKIVSDIIDTPKPVRDRLAAILSLIDRK
jgi:tripartite-type tricarboxylate transporter receptor subunit TctC